MGSSPILIDGDLVRGLAAARQIRGATIVGRPGGWSVLVRYDGEERLVAGDRSEKAQVWGALDGAAGFVRSELGLVRFDVDAAADMPPRPEEARPEGDASPLPSQRTDYEEWARRDIEAALREAEDPETVWFDNETVIRDVAAIFAEARAARGGRA